jgi:hypothetical protein
MAAGSAGCSFSSVSMAHCMNMVESSMLPCRSTHKGCAISDMPKNGSRLNVRHTQLGEWRVAYITIQVEAVGTCMAPSPRTVVSHICVTL